jgi:hypothetical protein
MSTIAGVWHARDTVAMAGLADEIHRFGDDAFALTVTEQSRPHVAPVQPTVDGSGTVSVLVLPGSRTERNAAVNPVVCLHWPGRDATDGYSLIVDGEATIERREHDTRLDIRPTKAVLHKLGAPGDHTNACGHDCVGIPLP